MAQIVEDETRLTTAGHIVQYIWESLHKRFPMIQTDAFVVMPNHIHGIVMIVEDNVGAIHAVSHPVRAASPDGARRPACRRCCGTNGELPLHPNRIQRRQMLLPKVIGYFKMNTSKQINLSRGVPGKRVWQRNYFERVIRNDDELSSLRQYIYNNPSL
ncbi:MAG TPA: hypothetical protein G4O11_02200 [Anaerolineae bacterium]|nr:hypothetical protein [Anaerolineae bacterium]